MKNKKILYITDPGQMDDEEATYKIIFYKTSIKIHSIIIIG